MNIKLIALDMDGTTFDSQRKITPENRAAIRAAQEKQIEVVVSTGRSNSELTPVLEQLPEIRYFCCGNGTKIYDRQCGSNIFEDPLPLPPARKILQILQQHDVMPELYADDSIYLDPEFFDQLHAYVAPEIEEIIHLTRTGRSDLRGFLQQRQTPVEKFNVFYSDDKIKNPLLAELRPFEVSFCQSFTNTLEILSPTASKGNSLRHLCEKFNLSAHEVMAIGDGSNDISMLQFAGCSVAMENAVTEAKNTAKFMTASNDASGVALSIYRYALT